MNTDRAKQPDVTPFGDELARAAARFLKDNQWFDGQTDLALSGRIPTGVPQFDLDPDNQRITRQLILDHLARR